MGKDIWRRIGWGFLLIAILMLLAYRIVMPVTPAWVDGVLLGIGALCVLVMNAVAKKQGAAESEDKLDHSKTSD